MVRDQRSLAILAALHGMEKEEEEQVYSSTTSGLSLLNVQQLSMEL